MSDDLEPAGADGPQPAPDLWRTQYGPQSSTGAATTPKPPLLASSASTAAGDPVRTRPLALAFLAAALVALLGGLLWAGIVIATGYNIGFLALFIGAATGLAAHRVAGAPVGAFGRVLAGLLAAGAIIVGNYVLFVHDVRTQINPTVGYLNGHAMSVFVHDFRTIVHGFDWVWIILAGLAAVRTSGGSAVLGMGRARSY
jgi:hypothetical protein